MPDEQEVPAHARPHHYLFSHRWLPDTFERIPEKMMLALARARSPEPLEASWRRLAKNLSEDERMTPDGLVVQTYRLPEGDATSYLAVVTMPPAENRTEACFAGLLVQPADGELAPEDEDDDGPRTGTEVGYWVLEFGDDPASRAPTTELRRWNGEAFADCDRHPEATEEAFVEALRAQWTALTRDKTRS